MRRINFDDIDGLRAQISEEFGPWSEPVTLSQDMIDHFAEMTGDRQWIHVDVERARAQGPFGGTIAHGFLTLGMATLIKNSADFRVVGHGNALNYGIDGLRFVAPVPAGAAVHGRTRIAAAEIKSGGTLLTMAVAIHVVGNDTPALVFLWKLLYRG
jgi:acyl dehydratase